MWSKVILFIMCVSFTPIGFYLRDLGLDDLTVISIQVIIAIIYLVIYHTLLKKKEK